MSNSNGKPRYVTYCNIPDENTKDPCGAQIVVTSGIEVPEIGLPPASNTKKYVEAIVGHMMKKHAGACQFALNSMEQFLAFVSLGFVRSEDPACAMFQHQFAQHLAQMSALPITDNAIYELVTQMGFTMEDPQREKVIGALRYVRDFQLRKMIPQVAGTPVSG